MLTQFLIWGLVTVGGALTTAIVWFALRAVGQLDKHQAALANLDKRLALIEIVCKLRHTDEAAT